MTDTLIEPPRPPRPPAEPPRERDCGVCPDCRHPLHGTAGCPVVLSWWRRLLGRAVCGCVYPGV
jgi:hypothetical protein